jgi:hypothetical protein
MCTCMYRRYVCSALSMILTFKKGLKKKNIFFIHGWHPKFEVFQAPRDRSIYQIIHESAQKM